MDAPSGKGKDDIYFCKWNGSNYEKPIILNNNINSEGHEVAEYEEKTNEVIAQWGPKDSFPHIEEIRFSKTEKITRWFSKEDGSLQIIQYDFGKKGAQIKFSANGSPLYLRVWRSDDSENSFNF